MIKLAVVLTKTRKGEPVVDGKLNIDVAQTRTKYGNAYIHTCLLLGPKHHVLTYSSN